MDSNLTPQQIYQLEAAKKRAQAPTPKIEYFSYYNKLNLVFYLIVFYCLTIFILVAKRTTLFQQPGMVVFLLFCVFGAIFFTIKAYQIFTNTLKPAMILSEEGIFVSNMSKPLPLEYIDYINVTIREYKGSFTWVFNMNLLPGCPDLGLKFSPIRSKYKKNKTIYSFTTLKFKDKELEDVLRAIDEYTEIIKARNIV